MKQTTVSTQNENSHNCPHCGEHYIEQGVQAGETQYHKCEGGCGKAYTVIYK